MANHFLGLRTVIYPAKELQKVKEWYILALGILPYFDQPFYVGFNVGGFELGLDPGGAVGTGGGTQAYWGVNDIAAVVNHLLSIGATTQTPIQDVGEGIKVAMVLDPFGNLFGVIENPHFNLDN